MQYNSSHLDFTVRWKVPEMKACSPNLDLVTNVRYVVLSKSSQWEAVAVPIPIMQVRQSAHPSSLLCTGMLENLAHTTRAASSCRAWGTSEKFEKGVNVDLESFSVLFLQLFVIVKDAGVMLYSSDTLEDFHRVPQKLKKGMVRTDLQYQRLWDYLPGVNKTQKPTLSRLAPPSVPRGAFGDLVQTLGKGSSRLPLTACNWYRLLLVHELGV